MKPTFDKDSRFKQICRIAHARGGECHSRALVKNSEKMEFSCSEGHRWKALPSNVLRGHWCRDCGNTQQGAKKSHSIEFAQKIAMSKGGICKSDSYANNRLPLLWQCERGHQWKACLSSVAPSKTSKGTWCPSCARKLSPEEHFEELAVVAQNLRGRLLSTSYRSAKSKLDWECEFGHQWSAIPDSVRRGTWCPTCGGSKKLELKEMQMIAASFGGFCRSKAYKNIGTPLLWECAEGHRWEARGSHVKNRHWCPICSTNRSERLCRYVFEHIFKTRFMKFRPDWLRNSRGRKMELDGYSEKLDLAFEYQGHQHYQEVEYFQKDGKSKLALRKNDDLTKISLCRKYKISLIVVPYWIKSDLIQKFIIEEIKNLRRSDLQSFISGVEPFDHTSKELWKDKRVDRMKEIARERGGLCLSRTYVNSQSKLKWQCKEKHTWLAVPASIVAGSWCSKCSDRSTAEKRTNSLESLLQIITSNDGKLLSGNAGSKQWVSIQCTHGHIWETRASVIYSGHWCPKCGKSKLAEKFSVKIDEYRKIIQNKGGILLSDRLQNQRDRLHVRCAKGHEWAPVAATIRRGHWCPLCSGKISSPTVRKTSRR